MTTVVFLGCGTIGQAGVEACEDPRIQWLGVRRRPASPEKGTLRWLALDLTDPSAFASLPDEVSVIVYTPAPRRSQPSSYAQVYPSVVQSLIKKYQKAQSLRRIILVSSTRVYGERGGAWVDENTAVEPEDDASRAIVTAEQALIQAFPKRATVLRLAGIYGPGRYWQIKRVLRGEAFRHQPPYFTNRIHQTDVVNILLTLVNRSLDDSLIDPLILGVDDAPVAEAELGQWLANQLSVELKLKQATGMPALQNKRCRNLGLQKLGFQYQYPSYQAGYAELVQAVLSGDVEL